MKKGLLILMLALFPLAVRAQVDLDKEFFSLSD